MKERVFSGIQPSGVIHIGNYLGAIKNWVALLTEYDCIFCIVDYHAVTVQYEVEELGSRILEGTKTLIAAGLDPAQCTIFVQSQVPEHTELTWILNTIVPVADLERMTQYKDKKQQNVDNINTGLLTYPILMASDILLYKTNAVPVGEDQVQHLELTREIARRFNTRFGDTFPEPQTILGEATRIRGLDGNAKMSKSMNNYIALLEEEEAIWSKLKVAVTDPARKRRIDPGNPYICNIFTLHRHFSSTEEVIYVEEGCKSAGIGCIDCKKILFKNINAFIEPFREKKRKMDSNEEYVRTVIEEGRKRCSSLAKETMEEVRRKIGLLQ
ncbi:MAG: tryptophanyl-tRNA synthetase [Spirochaetes bacterium DG_61]|jgi:tryptophanyl-tRNA synthetase|nr:MAG: tryptophanyl-tRNA synthetase [Spirochaetes bacterium DG_61]